MAEFGKELYATSNDSARVLIRRIYEEGGYLSGGNVLKYIEKGIYPDKQRPLLEEMTTRDLLIKIEDLTDARYELAPAVRHFILDNQAWKRDRAAEWKRLTSGDLDPHEKGKALEAFAATLFGAVFKVVERNLRTETEELDIVLEYAGGDPIWAASPTVLVECKNWSTRVPQKDISAFATKVRTKHVTLAFILSTSGFTRDACAQARDVFTRDNIALVLVSDDDIEAFFANDETPDDFLKRLLRKHKLRA